MKHFASLACLLACLILSSGCHHDELTPEEIVDQISDCNNGEGSTYYCNKAYVCKNGKIRAISKHSLERYLRYNPTAVHLEDNDGDGYVSQENECGLEVDCDDNDATVNAGAEEICDDCVDNNCNGLTDCEEEACETSSICATCDLIDYDLINAVLASSNLNTYSSYFGVSSKPGYKIYDLVLVTNDPASTASVQVVIGFYRYPTSSQANTSGKYYDSSGTLINVETNRPDITSDYADTCGSNLHKFAKENENVLEIYVTER